MKNSFDDGCREYRRLGRRRVLHAGSMTALGLGLSDLLHLEEAAAAPQEMSCILIWLRGGPSSIDTWDLKPEAPSEIRGPFRPIPTSVPGIRISEHLPLCARVADRFCLVRSVTHPREDHEGGSHVMSSGWNTWPQQRYPMYGVAVQKLLGYRSSLPPHIHLPEPPQEYSGGTHYLARQDLPFVLNCTRDPDLRIADIAPAAGLTVPRLERRRRLLETTGLPARVLAEAGPDPRAGDVFSRRAFDILTSSAAQRAFDITLEPETTRNLYGRAVPPREIVAQGTAGDIAPNEYNRSVVGQACLMGRRLVEAGCRFVTIVARGWDTHADNFSRLKDGLLPHLDRAIYGLLTDLHDRGMLDTTMVVVTGDFNRTPKINKDAGRDHWGHVQTVFLAGGGLPGGTVIGASDEHCAYPAERVLTPGDVAATIYHKFGIPPETELHSPDGRPFPLLPENAAPIRELI